MNRIIKSIVGQKTELKVSLTGVSAKGPYAVTLAFIVFLLLYFTL